MVLSLFNVFPGKATGQDAASLAASGSSTSRASSTHDPLRRSSRVKDPYFAAFHPLSLPQGEATIYCHAQMSSGNGFPPLSLADKLGRPAKHFAQGISIGDIGYITWRGEFAYIGNIFYPPDDPVQDQPLPGKFAQIEPPLSEWTIKAVENYFPPGAVIPSEGVRVNRLAESPLKVHFTSSANHGAVTILPTGAHREDLADTSKLYAYIKAHAGDWYNFVNRYPSDADCLPTPPIMNGSIYVVTGRDYAMSYATAAFPLSGYGGLIHDFQYTDTGSERGCWEEMVNPVMTRCYKASEHQSGPYAVFLRGITVALGAKSWKHYIPVVPTDKFPVYSVITQPVFPEPQKTSSKLLNVLGFNKPTSIPTGAYTLFHPAVIVLQLLIDVMPAPEVALFEDHVWCQWINGRNPTKPRVVEMVEHIIQTYDVVVAEGVAILVKKTEVEAPEPPSSILTRLLHVCLRLLRQNVAPEARFRAKSLRTLSRIVSTPPRT